MLREPYGVSGIKFWSVNMQSKHPTNCTTVLARLIYFIFEAQKISTRLWESSPTRWNSLHAGGPLLIPSTRTTWVPEHQQRWALSTEPRLVLCTIRCGSKIKNTSEVLLQQEIRKRCGPEIAQQGSRLACIGPGFDPQHPIKSQVLPGAIRAESGISPKYHQLKSKSHPPHIMEISGRNQGTWRKIKYQLNYFF